MRQCLESEFLIESKEIAVITVAITVVITVTIASRRGNGQKETQVNGEFKIPLSLTRREDLTVLGLFGHHFS